MPACLESVTVPYAANEQPCSLQPVEAAPAAEHGSWSGGFELRMRPAAAPAGGTASGGDDSGDDAAAPQQRVPDVPLMLARHRDKILATGDPFRFCTGSLSGSLCSA